MKGGNCHEQARPDSWQAVYVGLGLEMAGWPYLYLKAEPTLQALRQAFPARWIQLQAARASGRLRDLFADVAGLLRA